MNERFLNWTQAVLMMNEASDRAVISALCMIHQGIQHCCGIPITSITQVRQPRHSLDLLWFYKAVETIILKWTAFESLAVTDLPNKETLAGVSLSRLDTFRQLELLKFATALSNIPRLTAVDESFCCWLFFETILLPDLLPSVMNGSIATILDEQENGDLDSWATGFKGSERCSTNN